MEVLSIDLLQEIDGGVKWSKVGGGAAAVVGGIATAAGTGWTGAGMVVGTLTVGAGIGVIIRGFEDD